MRISGTSFFLSECLPRTLVCMLAVLAISACSSGGSDAVSDEQLPAVGAANPDIENGTAGKEFTAEELANGSLLLEWSADPLAESYVILVDGEIVAEFSADTRSYIVVADGSNPMNGTIQVFSRTADDVLVSWVVDPQLILESGSSVTDVGEQTESENSSPAGSISSGGETDVQSPPNLAPVITDTSYHCDPVVEAAVFTVGDASNFTLSVKDESPLTLSYAADSSKTDVVSVTVDEDGIFTISAVAEGESYLWLTAEDQDGLVDEYELLVVVE